MNMQTFRSGFLALALASFIPVVAPAQTTPPQDPAFAAAKTAFEKLDVEARKAIQRDLVWAGGFNGSASGEFGALTHAAIRRFELAAKTTSDGVLAPPEREKLALAAQKARDAVGFRVDLDASSKMRLGIPEKLLARRGENPSGGGRWQDKDGKITLDLSPLKGEEPLEALFEKGTSATVAGRKITYKLLRQDFFVISGETAGGKFYRRVEKGPDGSLHGLSIGYDKALAREFDPLVIAIASTFEAFPQGRGAASPVTTQANASARARAPVPAPIVIRAAPRLTAIAIAEGRFAVAETAFGACKSPVFDVPTRPVAVPVPGASAKGLIAISGHKASAIPLGQAKAGDGLLLQRDGDGALVAAAASLVDGKVAVPLQPGGAGAAIFDSAGALIGIVTSSPVEKFAVAGVMPLMRHDFASVSEIAALAGTSPGTANLALPGISAGEIAARQGAGIVSVRCSSR